MITRGVALGAVAIAIVACGGSSVTDSGDAAATGGTSSGGTSSGGTSSGGTSSGGTAGLAGADAGCPPPGGCGGQAPCCDPSSGQFVQKACQCGPCPPGTIEDFTCYGPGECGADQPCAVDEFCQFKNGACTEKGVCQKRPASCDADAGAAACGCDGYARSSECAVHAAGFDVGGACQITCGSTTCTRGLEYCEDHPSNSALTACKPLPSGCGLPVTCACLAAEPCGSSCMSGDPSRLTCPS